ncbi:hypothetical protein GA0070607_6252 [Micromonospora coriariae]|uniref:Uncharacterized protein n=1 Tax=Micromonospora coriariae TaxID=285665 RepID=A0A1C4Y4V9_9ACTN|nr:hypothetical protein [Micromonospora coriariae]SCF15753.1 hypothetical protein GA0070607_6252 [Micromonospora coriariae]
MFDDLLRASAALLHDVSVQVQDVRHNEPAPGSVWRRETALDATVGDEGFPVPYSFAHHVHRTLNYAAAERLETLSWCVQPGFPQILSAIDLARAAAETASLAAWLGRPEADGEARLRRLMFMVQRADGEQRGLQTALGVELSSSSKAILDWAGRRRLRAERYPSREALLAAVDEDAGSIHYKRLSSFTHGNLDAMMALYIEIEQAQKGDSRLLEVHALSVATVAASYMLGGLASLARITGIGQPELAALDERAEEMEEALEWAAEQVPDLAR